MFAIAIASTFNGFLVGMDIGGLGFGMYIAVDFALVVDVLPDQDKVAKDLGVLNIASALPFSHCAGHRAGHPGDRQRQLQRAVRGRRRVRRHRSRGHPAREGSPINLIAAARPSSRRPVPVS